MNIIASSAPELFGVIVFLIIVAVTLSVVAIKWPLLKLAPTSVFTGSTIFMLIKAGREMVSEDPTAYFTMILFLTCLTLLIITTVVVGNWRK